MKHLGFRLLAAVRRLLRPPVDAGIRFRNTYAVTCRDAAGNLLWTERIKNIVVTEGLDDVLSKYFEGSTYTAAWFVGLVDNASWTAFAATDTAAKITTTANPPTTNGWQEWTDYDEANRQTLTLGTASGGSIDNVGNLATFTINDTGTLKGVFLVSTNTKGGTTGVLFGEVAFGSTQAVVATNVIEVQITLTAASA